VKGFEGYLSPAFGIAAKMGTVTYFFPFYVIIIMIEKK